MTVITTTTAAQEATPSTSVTARGEYSRNGADTCLNCHEEAPLLSLFRTKHGSRGNPHGPFGHGGLQCEACHGPGGAHAGRVPRGQQRPALIRFGRKSQTPVAAQNEQCLGCHEPDLRHGWRGGVHAEGGVGCADCHRSHAVEDTVLKPAAQAETCFGCHTQLRAETLKPFVHPTRHGKAPCSSCHEPHGSSTEAGLIQATLNDTCHTCHADKRGPFLWEHAPVAEDCGLCHAPHGSVQPALLKQRAPLLCQECHSQAGHPSIPLAPANLPEGTPSAYLLGGSCLNCHSQVHGSNHPSGAKLTR